MLAYCSAPKWKPKSSPTAASIPSPTATRSCSTPRPCSAKAGARYAGILLDVFYDHLLAANWARYADVPLDALIARFYAALEKRADLLPPNLARIAPYMIEQDWLGSYRDYAGVDLAIRRMSTRLSKNGDVMRDALADLERNYATIEIGFHRFFPELVAYVDDRRIVSSGNI